MPHNNSPYNDEDMHIAMRTSRGIGAVAADRMRVPQVARLFMRPHHTILDFGAGLHALNAQQFKNEGFNVTAYDFHGSSPNVKALGLHDENALNRRYDIVYASNLLNVQNNSRMLANTLNQLASATKVTGGKAIMNLATNPRKGAFTGMTTSQGNAMVDMAIRRRFRHVEPYKIPGYSAPIWIASNPIHFIRPHMEP